MSWHERIGGPSPFVFKHGDVGVTDATVADPNLNLVRLQFAGVIGDLLQWAIGGHSCIRID
jgi:hypothetical protein